jgi:hypothetical protein
MCPVSIGDHTRSGVGKKEHYPKKIRKIRNKKI